MTMDWRPGIREGCGHWRGAPMLQQTFEAMERNLEQNNDACIDCAKTVVEVVCRVVVESFHTQQAPLKPTQETPSLSDWLEGAHNIVLEQVMRRPWPNGWSDQMRVLAPPV